MRILYLCADRGIPLGGQKGASAHVRGLVGALTSFGHEVLVVASSTDGEEDVGAPVVAVPPPETAVALPDSTDVRMARALGHLWNNVSVENTLKDVLTSFEPDLLYERYSPFGVAGGLLAKRLGLFHILEVNAPLAWEGKRYRGMALADAAESLEHAAFEAASLIVCVSEGLRETLIAGGAPAAKIATVPNGVEVDRFCVKGDTYENGLAGKIVVGFVGSLKPWHGVDVLAEAFSRLVSDPRFHLLVVGSGPESKTIKKLMRKHPDRITHVARIAHSEVPRYVRAMDVTVAPYPPLERFYFSPLKVLEYMAAGRPIVASRIGQLCELIRSGETGVLVPPGDADALAGAIRELADDPDRRRALGRAAAEEARQSHRWTDRAARILELRGAVS
jgi:glycosyltransferase involved in cell wall biosynthesis